VLSLFVLYSFSQNNTQALAINTTAPEFTAKDQYGNEISLDKLKEKGPVVVVFYRGNWCPYCNKELKLLQDSLQYITDKGASVVAISPEASEGIDKTVVKTGASFPVLHDAGLKIAKAYNLSYEVDEKTRTTYLEKSNLDLLKINNQNKIASLPVPAVYIVSKEGTIIYRFFDKDITKRPSIMELLDHLK
jgi:peroxiredoxin